MPDKRTQKANIVRNVAILAMETIPQEKHQSTNSQKCSCIPLLPQTLFRIRAGAAVNF
jgi:hypothetical protein